MHVIQLSFLLQTMKIVLVVLVACFAAVNCQDCVANGLIINMGLLKCNSLLTVSHIIIYTLHACNTLLSLNPHACNAVHLITSSLLNYILIYIIFLPMQLYLYTCMHAVQFSRILPTVLRLRSCSPLQQMWYFTKPCNTR